MAAPARRGRPLDPAVSQAALQATLELLDERGYAGLRVDDVATRAGVGLGGLYRRWATKAELVKAALLSAAADQHVTTTDDPYQDLVNGLLGLNAALAGRGGRFLALLFSGAEPELAAAIRDTKLVPLREANRQRLRRVVGDGDDVAWRADAGVGVMVLHFMAEGAPMTAEQIVEQVVPVMVGRPADPARPASRTG
jgi:AcrR family transcriptional regulator